jgi:putative phosphoribosyl transferase
MYTYKNRVEAAEILAEHLQKESFNNPIIFGLPRGGVPLAAIISRRLNIPWDVLIVRKIGAPGYREYGIGAMTEDEKAMLTDRAHYDPELIQEIVDEERAELRRRVKHYRQGKPLINFTNRDVILIDDGLATGVTTTAAARFLRANGANKVILAVPVAPAYDNELIESVVDKIICPYRPISFGGVGGWYDDFSEVSDQEVIDLLEQRGEHYDQGNIDRV